MLRRQCVSLASSAGRQSSGVSVIAPVKKETVHKLALGLLGTSNALALPGLVYTPAAIASMVTGSLSMVVTLAYHYMNYKEHEENSIKQLEQAKGSSTTSLEKVKAFPSSLWMVLENVAELASWQRMKEALSPLLGAAASWILKILMANSRERTLPPLTQLVWTAVVAIVVVLLLVRTSALFNGVFSQPTDKKYPTAGDTQNNHYEDAIIINSHNNSASDSPNSNNNSIYCNSNNNSNFTNIHNNPITINSNYFYQGLELSRQ